MILQVLAIIGQLRKFVGFDVMERVSEGHVAAAVVMPVTFAIRCDVDEARSRMVVSERGQQPVGESLSIVK